MLISLQGITRRDTPLSHHGPLAIIHAVKEAWRSKAQLGRYHKSRLIKDGGSMKGWGVEVGWGGGHCWKTCHLTHDSGFIFCNLQLQADKKSGINVIPPHTHTMETHFLIDLVKKYSYLLCVNIIVTMM